jgi:hypothetical protein
MPSSQPTEAAQAAAAILVKVFDMFGSVLALASMNCLALPKRGCDDTRLTIRLRICDEVRAAHS